MSKQRTIKLKDGRKVRILVRSRTYVGNPIGFRAHIYVDGVETRRWHVCRLTAQEAMDVAYIWWVQEQEIPA